MVTDLEQGLNLSLHVFKFPNHSCYCQTPPSWRQCRRETKDVPYMVDTAFGLTVPNYLPFQLPHFTLYYLYGDPCLYIC